MKRVRYDDEQEIDDGKDGKGLFQLIEKAKFLILYWKANLSRILITTHNIYLLEKQINICKLIIFITLLADIIYIVCI